MKGKEKAKENGLRCSLLRNLEESLVILLFYSWNFYVDTKFCQNISKKFFKSVKYDTDVSLSIMF